MFESVSNIAFRGTIYGFKIVAGVLRCIPPAHHRNEHRVQYLERRLRCTIILTVATDTEDDDLILDVVGAYDNRM